MQFKNHVFYKAQAITKLPNFQIATLPNCHLQTTRLLQAQINFFPGVFDVVV